MQILTHEWHKVTEDSKTSVLSLLSLSWSTLWLCHGYIHVHVHCVFSNVSMLHGVVIMLCVSMQPTATRCIMQMVNCAMVLGDSKVSCMCVYTVYILYVCICYMYMCLSYCVYMYIPVWCIKQIRLDLCHLPVMTGSRADTCTVFVTSTCTCVCCVVCIYMYEYTGGMTYMYMCMYI